jgi:ankyrin repeat protein
MCIEVGKEICAELLLTHGLSLDDVDIYGQTPMFYAISENRLEIVRKYATKCTFEVK